MKLPAILFACLSAVLLVLCAAPSFGVAQTSGPGGVPVLVDPRVELMSILFRLAGNPEYTQGRIPAYNKDIDDYFGKYKNHPAVQAAVKMRAARGVSFDAVMSMAVHLSDAVELKEKVPFDPYPEGLDKRWTLGGAREFLTAARQFVKDTNFAAFVEAHKPLYSLSVARMKEVLEESGRINWLAKFFGPRADLRLAVILGMVNGGPSYGVHVSLPAGMEIFAIPGVWLTDPQGQPRFEKSVIPIVMHEFIHSYTNPLVNAHISELKAAGSKIFPLVAKQMQKQAYGIWEAMMYESMVRASIVRYTLTFDGPEAARKAAETDESRSFLWVRALADLMGEYEKDRTRYPTLEAFFPRIVGFFNSYAAGIEQKIDDHNQQVAARWEAIREKAPKIASLIPADGAQDVDPRLKTITIAFDRPMKDRSWAVIVLGGRDHFPEVAGQVSFDAARRVFTMPVKLKPDWEYEFGLNANDNTAFQSEEGVPLIPVTVKFKTKKISP
jgi:hypothetical protein